VKSLAVQKVQPLRSGHPVVVGVLSFEGISDRFEIPYRDPVTKSGYQRTASKARVSKLAKAISLGQVDLVPSVLLSCRKGTILENSADDIVLRLQGGAPLYVVDGQHRLLALYELFKKDPKRWGGFLIPFVCIVGATELEEAKLFLDINQNAKKVKLDLALALIAEASTESEIDTEPVKSLREGQLLAQDLEASCPVWHGRISFAGGSYPDGLIGNGAMGQSFKPWLSRAFVRGLSRTERLKIVNSYWIAISQILPECFVDPTKFGIQKQTGVKVMHRLLPEIHEHVLAIGLKPEMPSSFAKVLSGPLKNFSYTLPNGVVLKASEFWRTGSAGGAGKFTSGAGQADLAQRLKLLIEN